MPVRTPDLPAPRRVDMRAVSRWVGTKIFGQSGYDHVYADNSPVRATWGRLSVAAWQRGSVQRGRLGSVACTSTSRATAAELSAPQQINLSASCTTSPTATSIAPIRESNFFSARTNGFPRAFPNSLQLSSAFTSSRPCCWSQSWERSTNRNDD